MKSFCSREILAKLVQWAISILPDVPSWFHLHRAVYFTSFQRYKILVHLYLYFQAKYTHGDLDRDFSTVVIFNDQVYRHEWDPSLVEGFDEKEQFYPTFMLFTNRTDQPHQIDQSFFVVEQSDVNKRIRIGQGSAEGSSLSNTIKFSISQGQSILDVKTAHGEIWIQVTRAN